MLWYGLYIIREVNSCRKKILAIISPIQKSVNAAIVLMLFWGFWGWSEERRTRLHKFC